MASTERRVRGTMIWFNEEKDVGAIRTDAGERIEVPGSAFAPGEKPVGRCAGRIVEFDEVSGAVDHIVFVRDSDRGRARRRRR